MSPHDLLRSAFAAVALVSVGMGGNARADDGFRTVVLTTGDGVELAGRYFPGTVGAKSPAVLVLDDIGADARPEWCNAVARELAKQGCAVLCFDFRGHGDSEQVNLDFWDDVTNRQLIKGFKQSKPPETIHHADFKAGYWPMLVNDVVAARGFLDRRNDVGECNTGQIFVVGTGHGATLGQLWVASEWSRFRVAGFQQKLAVSPEGRDIAGCVWVDPRYSLARHNVPMLDLLKRSEQKRSTLVGMIHSVDDAASVKFAKQCRDAFNPKGRNTIFVAEAVETEGGKAVAEREGTTDRVTKLLAKMRKVQELPPWEDRDFVDRRYVWAFPGTPFVLAKDESESLLRPLPVARLLTQR